MSIDRENTLKRINVTDKLVSSTLFREFISMSVYQTYWSVYPSSFYQFLYFISEYIDNLREERNKGPLSNISSYDLTCRKQRQRIDLTSILQRATSSSSVDIVDMGGNRAGKVPEKRAVGREKQRQQTGVIKRGRVFGREMVARVKAETWHGLTFLSAAPSLRVPSPRGFLAVCSHRCNIPAGDITAGDPIRLISSGVRQKSRRYLDLRRIDIDLIKIPFLPDRSLRETTFKKY